MKDSNGLKLMLAIRRICQRAAAEGKTTVSPATMRQMDRHIRQMRKNLRAGVAQEFVTPSLF